MSYISNESGTYQVYVQPFPSGGGKWQISSKGGIDPRWTRDDRQIHFRINRSWWVADFDPGDGGARPVRIGDARLIRNDLPRAEIANTYGLTADGKALLVATPEEQEGAPLAVTVVTDWFVGN